MSTSFSLAPTCAFEGLMHSIQTSLHKKNGEEPSFFQAQIRTRVTAVAAAAFEVLSAVYTLALLPAYTALWAVSLPFKVIDAIIPNKINDFCAKFPTLEDSIVPKVALVFGYTLGTVSTVAFGVFLSPRLNVSLQEGLNLINEFTPVEEDDVVVVPQPTAEDLAKIKAAEEKAEAERLEKEKAAKLEKAQTALYSLIEAGYNVKDAKGKSILGNELGTKARFPWTDKETTADNVKLKAIFAATAKGTTQLDADTLRNHAATVVALLQRGFAKHANEEISKQITALEDVIKTLPVEVKVVEASVSEATVTTAPVAAAPVAAPAVEQVAAAATTVTAAAVVVPAPVENKPVETTKSAPTTPVVHAA